MFVRLLGGLAATMLVASAAVAEPETSATPATTSTPATTGKAAAAVKTAPAKVTGPEAAVIETSVGTIVIQLHPDEAPKTVANFKKLIRQKFYDGTYFHRVIPGFMIQGGDPNTKNADPSDDGMGGPGWTVPAEIKGKHVRGAVATARLGDQANPKKDSSGSQFFIDVAAQPSLDAGGYTVFGHVIAGMDVVDKIVAFGADPNTPKGPAGPNPGKLALIKRATLKPLADYQKAAAAEAPAK